MLIIPLVFACALYLHAVDQIRAQQRAYAQATLAQAHDMADNMLSTVEDEMLNLARNERINGALKLCEPLSKAELYELYMMADSSLANIQLDPHGLAKHVVLHFCDIDYVYTLSSSYSKDLYYRVACGLSPQQQSEFTDLLESGIHHLDYTIANAPYPGSRASRQLICLQSLPLYADSPSLVAMMILDMDALENLLINIDADKQGCAFIVDSRGEVICATGNVELTSLVSYADALSADERTLADSNVSYSVSAVRSSMTDWAYVSIVRESYVIDAVSDIRKFRTVLVAIVCVLGASLIVYFTRHHQDPLIRLSQLVFSNAADGYYTGDVRQITRQVERLIAHNRVLNDRVANVEIESRRQAQLWSDRRDTLRETLLLKLVTSTSDTAHAYLEQLSSMGICFPHTLVLVAVSKGAALPELSSGEDDGDLVVYAFTDLQCCKCVIVNLTNEAFLRLGPEACHEPADADSDTAIGLSAPHVDPGSLGEAYREAVAAMNYCCMRGESMARYDALKSDDDRYLFSIEREYKLIGYICAGDEGDALAELDSLADLNMNKRVLSLSMIRAFMFDIATALTRAAQSQGNGADYMPVEPENYRTFAEFYSDVQRVIRRMCEYSRDKKRSQSQKLRDEVISDVEQNYTDPQMSVAYLAYRHGITPSYLSHYFREQTGQTLLDRINRTRIDASLPLLRETDLPISEIAHRLGYADDSSFTRVFRKYMCKAPGAYRREER